MSTKLNTLYPKFEALPEYVEIAARAIHGALHTFLRLELPADTVVRGGPPSRHGVANSSATATHAPAEAIEAPTSGSCGTLRRSRRETGLDLFRRSFTDCRDSILGQHEDDDAKYDFASDILDRVQRALGI